MRTPVIDRLDLIQAFASVHEQSWRIDVGGDRECVLQVCQRPELQLLARDMIVRTNPHLEQPFHVPTASLIELSSRASQSPEALRVYMRHALEIALWHRITGPHRTAAQEIAAAALASVTAIRYLDSLSISDRDAAIASDAEWFTSLDCIFTVRRERHDDIVLAPDLLAQCVDRLLPLQRAEHSVPFDTRLCEESLALIELLLPLAAPTERLLAYGGDGRLAVDPRSRLNKYGCSTVPRPNAVTFSSCTASSTSEIAYRSAELARAALIEATLRSGSYRDACGAFMDHTRQDVGDVLGIEVCDGAELVLAASGTDCELFALYAALAGHARDLLSIVIGPDEIGSGSLPAASGCHFDAVAPLTRTVDIGKPVEGLPVGRVRIETLPLRDEEGEVIPLAELDARVTQLARAAVAQGASALVHVVDGSKTGLRAPSLACVRSLQRELGDRVIVLIDAAQTRRRLAMLMECVADGAMVMISGSKFFTGSPFSGALIVPARYGAALENVEDVPKGFGAYISRLEVPARWSGLRGALPETPNLGLLLRWRTAIAEMHAFQQVPEHLKNAWYADFREAVIQGCNAYGLALVEAPVGERALHPDDAWDAWPTIFTFLVEIAGADGQHTFADYDQASQIYLALNRDLSADLPPRATDDERSVAATPCHIGQPVRVRSRDGSVKGGLRVAVGARYVSRIAFDASLGKDPDERKASQLAGLDLTLRKVSLLAQYWFEMRKGGDATQTAKRHSS